MERFAFKIDKALRDNLYKICRLCGMDNPEMVPILTGAADGGVVVVDGEPELSEKIQQCVGFIITKDDKMPQTMCTLCVEKINDFHEFREMCFATNSQTRKLLGLKPEVQKKIVFADVKPEVEIKNESSVSTALGKKGARKRKLDEANNAKSKGVVPASATAGIAALVVGEVKTEDTNAQSGIKKFRLTEALPLPKSKNKVLTPKEKRMQEIQKKQVERLNEFQKKHAEKNVQLLPPKEEKEKEIKSEPSEKPVVAVAAAAVAPSTAPSSTLRNKQLCNICDQYFTSKIKLEKHLSTHVPVIPRYYCNTCNETIKKAIDIKNHQLWHKLSKTPYICALCGESLISIYAFTRHLREHCSEITTAVVVLDRQCPQCQQTYETNFLYNTHPCAVRTKRCAGCNRKQNSETAYLSHAANCAKTYLNYSKHIPAAAVAAESCVRIKNENDVEEAAAAEALARSSGISLDLTPVVSLTRLPSPVVMAFNQCVAIPAGHEALLNPPRCSKRTGSRKSGVSKKDFKRVDDLLKSTIDALVSIKHEPEVHVETDADADGGASVSTAVTATATSDGELDAYTGDDFHHGDADDSDGVSSAMLAGVVIKQEPEIVLNDHDIGMEIKQEIIDVDEYEGSSSAAAGKVPILKLKIKKEHGTLNSSLVDGESARSERKKNKKEKKKRKDTEKNRDKLVEKIQNSQDVTERRISDNAAATGLIQPCVVRIKQERLDDDSGTRHDAAAPSISNDADEPMSTQPEATVMTSIPLMQFQIACISSGVEFTGEPAAEQQATLDPPPPAAELTPAPAESNMPEVEEEVRDVKPNRMELDRMMQITNITSGVDMPASTAEEAADEEEAASTTQNKRKSVAKKTKKSPAKAMKSTGGVARVTRNSSIEMATMQILEVRSGADVPPIIIKPEPRNRGYSDEPAQEPPTTAVENMDCDEERQLNEFTISEIAENHNKVDAHEDDDDEQTYIAKIDFNNLKIKQEKDIEVSEVQLSHTAIPVTSARSCNGIKRRTAKRKMQKRKRKDSCNSKDGMKLSTTVKKPNAEPVGAGHDGNVKLETHDSDVYDEEDFEEEEEGEEEEEEEDDNDEGEEEEEEDDKDRSEQEVREYREMEWPPLLLPGDEEQQEATEQNETDEKETPHNAEPSPMIGEASAQHLNKMKPTFVITNVRSHAEVEAVEALRKELPKRFEKEENTTDYCNNDKDCVEEKVINRKNKENKAVVEQQTDNPREEQISTSGNFSSRKEVEQQLPDEKVAGGNTFDFKISAGCSDMNFETEIPAPSEKTLGDSEAIISGDIKKPSSSAVLDKTKDKDAIAETASISVQVAEEKEATTKAQPFYEPRSTAEALGEESNSSAADSTDGGDDALSTCGGALRETTDAVEEQQNLLNHEMDAAAAAESDFPTTTTVTAFQLHPYLEDITSSSGSGFSCSGATNDATEIASTSNAAAAALAKQHCEETDNMFNESADAALRQQQMYLAPPNNHLLLNDVVDDSNVNEIAENNNNANIERELLDDNNAAAVANANPVPEEFLALSSSSVDKLI